MDDEAIMDRALALATEAASAGEAPVGCVIVDADGAIIAEGANAPIASLGNYRLKPGLTLYVSLEPCAMCAGAIANARIERLVYGAPDAKGGGVAHGARVFDQPQCHWKPAITGDVRAEEAARLLKEFFKARR